MKHKLIISVFLFLSFGTAKACEICGCGLGNYYIGLMPQFSHRFIGVRYQYRYFKTVMAGDPTQFSHDHYQTAEIWAGWNLGKKWQLIALLPYNYIHQVSDDGVTKNQGIGDIALMANYKVFTSSKRSANGKTLSQQLWFGGGIKLPTGKFNVDATDPALTALANTQTGSASTDFMLNALYNIRLGKMGFNTSVSYKMNTTNSDKYLFGNKFSSNVIASYSLRTGSIGIMPNLALLYEHTASNTYQKATVAQTGGHLLSTAAGMEMSLDHFTLGANVQLPLSQNFSDGQTELKVKGMVHLTYSL